MSHRATEADISADFDTVTGTIDRNIYGHFAEHLGGCIYGGIWAEPGLELPTLRDMRMDVLELVRALRPPNIRWPGGCFSEYYHWEDGIGPVESRPWRFDWKWKKPEPNIVGTHEFVDFCAEVGAEPVVAVNVRTGTPEEAAAWVRYCNSPRTTPDGARRAANGDPEPFAVKLWDVGNESWDLGAEESAQRFLAYHEAMTEADPEAKLVAIGSSGWKEEWNRTMLQVAGETLDYIAPHHYDGWRVRDLAKGEGHYYANVASACRIEDTMRRTAELLDEMLPHRPEVGVSLDEWGVWTEHKQGLQHNYDLSDGLVAASAFNGMHRLSHRVTMANWAQLVNCLGMIQTDATRVCVTPVYLAFRLYSKHCGGERVESSVRCDSFDVPEDIRSGLTGLPYLDISATRTPDGNRCVLAVVNRHLTDDIETTLALTGVPDAATVTVHEMNAPECFSLNTLDAPETVTVREQQLYAVPATYRFPAHSLTVVVLSTA